MNIDETTCTPLWARALLAVDRAAARGAALQKTVRDELLWALADPRARDALTSYAYARDPRYREGSPLFERGLLDWEQRVFARLALAPGSRVLVGGAGGGREMRALARAGYAVTAFEPCATLAEAASQLAAGLPGCRVLRGGYADLPAAARRAGPLAGLVDGGPYALVLLGWRSLSHVVESSARAAMFASLARVAPGATVVASFMPRRGVGVVGARRRALRRALGALGAPGARPPGAEFLPNVGFVIALSRDDFASEVGPAYVVGHYEDATGEGIAVLEPRRAAAPVTSPGR